MGLYRMQVRSSVVRAGGDEAYNGRLAIWACRVLGGSDVQEQLRLLVSTYFLNPLLLGLGCVARRSV